MVDRIADIWGARTPYARGGLWPDRVDTALQAGIEAGDTGLQLRWLRTRMKQAAPQALLVAE